MIVHSLIDSTQKSICSHLATTEVLIAKALSKISGKDSSCEIETLEDLGFSNNVVRMSGGFFTGMCARWEPKIPFIPIDATINACGVSIYECDEFTSFEQFSSSIKNADRKLALLGIKGNFNSGNHFISYCKDCDGKSYLLIHASDNAYKYGEKGLYPKEGCWYWKDVQIEQFQDRYLRYLIGDTADKFYSYYLEAEESNPLRNDLMAELLFEGQKPRRILYVPHYGMPTKSSVAIGCQWRDGDRVLLTSTGKDIFILSEDVDEPVLFPHGFGVKLNEECKSISFTDDNMIINDSLIIGKSSSLLASGFVSTRNSSQALDDDFVRRFLDKREFSITKRLVQFYSYSRNGLECFKN